MNVNRLQAIISIVVVIAFAVVTSVIALTPVIGGYPPENYKEYLETYASIFTGTLGLIFGYYFGKSTTELASHNSKGKDKNDY